MKLSERLEALAALRRAAPLHSEAAAEAAWLEEAAELARRVEDAVVVCAGKSAVMGEGWQIYGTDGDSVASLPVESGQRVRLVPEQGEG